MTDIKVQRQLPFDDWHKTHHSHVSADGLTSMMTYTIDRDKWIMVHQHVGFPAYVIATNKDADPDGDESVWQDMTLTEFSGEDAWDAANEYVRSLLRVLGLLERADTQIDHFIAASRAVLHESKKRRNQ